MKKPRRVSRKTFSCRRRKGTTGHLGAELLRRYRNRISTGWEDLERFERIDRLEKPVVGFGFRGGKKVFLELESMLRESGYAFHILTTKKKKVNELSKMGCSSAYIYVSKFPKLIKFISKHGNIIPHDMWGLLFGYPLDEVYEYTYDNEAWRRRHF